VHNMQDAPVRKVLFTDDFVQNPYPAYRRLLDEGPLHYLDVGGMWAVWAVFGHAECSAVAKDARLSAKRAERFVITLPMNKRAEFADLVGMLGLWMIFMDPPEHSRLRKLMNKGFSREAIETLRPQIEAIVNRMLEPLHHCSEVELMREFAYTMPVRVISEMLGVPVEDHRKLKTWSANFAEMLGNFQHNPDHAKVMLQTVEEMTAYFREAVEEQKRHPREGLIHSLLTAEIDGDRLTDDEIVANVIITLVGGLETTTNLIGNGVLTLLRYPEQMQKLRDDLSLIPSAVEEMLRFESPSQHTARLAPEDRELGGKLIRKRQAVIAIMAAANRDPGRFSDPDRFDIARQDNRHLAFGYAAHFCFGAPLARMEGQIVFEGLLRTFSNLQMEPQDLVWRTNLGLRGLRSLKVKFDANKSNEPVPSGVSQTGITELR